MLGFLSAYSEGLAAQVEAAGAAAALVPLLSTSGLQDYVACAAVWALGNLGRHSAQLANAVADAGGAPLSPSPVQTVAAAGCTVAFLTVLRCPAWPNFVPTT